MLHATTIQKPKMTARAIVIHEDGILLMYRERTDRGKPEEYFTTLGGWVDIHETIEECLHRELREEAEITVEIIEKIGEVTEHREYDGAIKQKHHHIYLVKNTKNSYGQPIWPEAERYKLGNRYEVKKMQWSDLPHITLNSSLIHKHLLEYAYQKNFIS